MSLNKIEEVDNSRIFSEKNSKQLPHFINLIPALIAYVDRYYRYQYVNNAYVNWLGIDADSLIGKSVAEVVGEDRFLNVKPYIDLALSGVSSQFKSSVYNKDGLRNVDVSLTPDFNETNEVKGYAVYIRDITEEMKTRPGVMDEPGTTESNLSPQIKVEQALKESEARYRNLLQLLPAAVYTCNAQGYIELFNDAAVDLWGRKPEVGKDMWCGSWKIFDVATGASVPLDTCPMAKTLKEGKAVKGQEIVIERPDGVRRNVVPYPRPIFDLAGNLTGAINMLVDITEERLAARAMKEKDERFRMVAHLVPIIVWMADEGGNFIYFNNEWTNVTGEPAAKGLGDGWLNCVHPEERQHIQSEFLQAKAERRIYSDKFRCLNTDGKYISLQANGIPRFNEAGEFIGYLGVFQNIDQQEHAKAVLETQVSQRTADLTIEKEALKRSEQRYQRMITEVQDYAIILLDTEGKIQNWNKGAESIKGYTASEAMGKSLRMFYTKEDQERHLPEQLLKQAVEKGRAQHEGWRVRKNGNLFWGSIVITALHDDSNELIGFSKVTRDLSERKMAEDHLKNFAEELKEKNENLKISEQRYQRMIAEVQDYAILQLNENGDIINWNAGAAFIKGYSAGEIIGKNFRIFYTKEDLENKLPDQLLERARMEGKAIHEGWRMRKNGTKFWGSVVLTALHNDEDEIIGFSKVTRDLTDKKIAEEALKEKNKELEKRNEELSEFAYISSHDLQEPLRKIQTFATRILELEGDSLSEKGKDYFNRIQAATLRMRTLIDDLLAYSRTNSTEQKFVETDLNKVLQDAMHELSEIIEDKRATIEYEPLPILTVVPFQFHQLIVNILANSIKFAKKDVPPHISIKSVIISGDEIQSDDADPQKKYHHISFKDNGIGFEPEYNAKVFEVFQRLHGRTEYQGTGIGLAICKKIVENHGGIITSEGYLNEGAIFHIYMPVS